VAKKFSLNPQPQLLGLYGFDKPLSRDPVRLPFPGALGVQPSSQSANPAATMYSRVLQFEEERGLLYTLFEEMELDPTIYGYLEQLSEDATQRDQRRGVVVWCESRNEDIEKIINAMLAQTGLSDETAQPIIRNIAKYGDNFEFIMAEAKEGVTRLIHYHPSSISRVHDEYGRLRGFVPYQPEELYNYGGYGTRAAELTNLSKPWDFLHFRRLGRSPTRVYGTSALYGARRIWRQVQMMEDKIALQRLLRNVDRYKHSVDVTGLGAVDAERKIERYKRGIKRDFNFDPSTMDFASVYSLIAEHEDLFIGRRKDDEANIEVLPGTKGMDDLRDLEMFLDRMFGALRAPKGYFGFEGGANFERSPSQQDVRFARQAGALQRIFLTEVTRLGMVHLTYRGIDPLMEDNIFTLYMVPPSYLEELYRLETLDARVRSLETLARVGNTLGVDEVTWLEVILLELPIFSRPFTEKVIEALRELSKRGETAENLIDHPKVKRALEEERKSKNPDWKVSSSSVVIPRDMIALLKGDERKADERVEFQRKFADSLEKAESERKKVQDEE
jgi:hypothetical protein